MRLPAIPLFALAATAVTALSVMPPALAQLAPAPVDGARVYVRADCAYCHEADGGGGWNGERLAGNRNITNDAIVVGAILFGGAFMPAQGDDLSNEEIAAVANFVRNNWGNQAPPITVEYVAAVRGPPIP